MFNEISNRHNRSSNIPITIMPISTKTAENIINGMAKHTAIIISVIQNVFIRKSCIKIYKILMNNFSIYFVV